MIEIGQTAPLFEGIETSGRILKLEDFKGKKVLLYFYPHDNTESCTKQACNLRDNFALLGNEGFVVIGVSSDDLTSHFKFTQKYSLPFYLIADIDLKIHHLYGTWQEKTLYGKKYMGTVRTTFLIDEQGLIRHIIRKIKTADHSRQVLDIYKS